MTEAVFAIPGDMHRRTGGFIYEAQVLRALNEIGCATAHLQLPDSFPDPNADDMRAAIRALQAVPREQVIILDGFIAGGIDPAALITIHAPKIAMIHHPLGLETGLTQARAAFLLQNEAAALREVDHVVVPSPHTAEVLIGRFDVPRGRITIAEPGFRRPETRFRPSDPPLILSVGLLAQRKGHDILLEALAQIRDLDWEARIIGKAHDRSVADALMAQRAALGLEERVAFLGELEQEALDHQFAAATIFALATRYEGYGMVFGEAMLRGLPIISCKTGAVPDTVGGVGMLVSVDDAQAFGEGLRNLLIDPALRETLAVASAAKGARLPRWRDTAARMAQAVRHVAALNR